MYRFFRPPIVKLALNLWPPFWGSGIRIVRISEGFREVQIKLKLRWWNKNANRTQYGGSIFSLTDPVYALMLIGILGEEYFVWDKEAEIRFIRPGSTDLYADFRIGEQQLNQILEATAGGDKYFPEFVVQVKNTEGEVVSEVKRVLYIRKKPQYREAPSQKEVLEEDKALS